MSKVKRQHYVPRFYLERWTNKSKQINVLDKSNNNIFINNIQVVASGKYFYDGGILPDDEKEKIRQIATEEGSIKEIEPYLQNNQMIEYLVMKIEGIANPILTAIISRLDGLKTFPYEYLVGNNVINDEEYYDLAYFIALQAVRTKEHRKIRDELEKGIMKKLTRMMPSEARLQYDIEDEFYKEIIQPGKFEVDLDSEYSKYMHVTQMFSHAEEIAKILLKHKWIIQRRTGRLNFITSDHPVIKYNNIQHPLYGAGFESPGIEIHYPISPDYEILIFEISYLMKTSLILSNPKVHIVDSDDEVVIRSNDLQVYHSERQLFSSNKKDFILPQKRINETPAVYEKQRIKFN